MIGIGIGEPHRRFGFHQGGVQAVFVQALDQAHRFVLLGVSPLLHAGQDGMFNK
ncbi:hypothetical protein A8U91_00503 [Halomonas elongata]|uniref:Uncharacterized protein n=1 Tax=Halomonas elongata TaxID=2746 RepID=A0A1B8P1R5_HALEL|nr:hypothetical protein [Halomonas elongata]OBX36162.1 hypothetical protein A8U91_00503 [Halomonas elongata]